MPMWSGCMWVTNTRVTGLPSSGPFSTARQALRVSMPPMPVSTIAQPSSVGDRPDVDERQRPAQRHPQPLHARRDVHRLAGLWPVLERDALSRGLGWSGMVSSNPSRMSALLAGTRALSDGAAPGANTQSSRFPSVQFWFTPELAH